MYFKKKFCYAVFSIVYWIEKCSNYHGRLKSVKPSKVREFLLKEPKIIFKWYFVICSNAFPYWNIHHTHLKSKITVKTVREVLKNFIWKIWKSRGKTRLSSLDNHDYVEKKKHLKNFMDTTKLKQTTFSLKFCLFSTIYEHNTDIQHGIR